MHTRRDFIKKIAALAAAVPLISLPEPVKDIGFDILTEPGNALIDNRRIPIVGHKPPYYNYNTGKLHDLYISKETLKDIRNWCVDQIDEETRREIYFSY